MINRRSLLVLPSALTVTACLPRALEVTVSGTAAAIEIAAFTRDGPFELFRSSTKIASLTVRRKDDADPEAPLWRVQAREWCQNAVHRLQYGVLPSGFELISAAAPLTEGVDYSLAVEECGPSGGGGAYFRLVDGNVQQF